MRSLIIPMLVFTFAASTSCNNTPVNKADAETNNQDTTQVAQPPIAPPPPPITYSFVQKKDWIGKKDSFEGYQHLDILIAINRTDNSHIKRLDSILVPNRYDLSINEYMPFPENVECLKPIQKIIIFSNPLQAFAAYEHGKLILQGQTNTGKKATPTPPNLYFCNWKAKRTTSTVNSRWILNWNFNVSNFGGVGFHQYALPGYPASHSCMRLQNEHAKFLYNWADQWVVKEGKEIAKGTPVLVYKQYPFGTPRPWYALVHNPEAMKLNEDSISNMISQHLPIILEKQKERNALNEHSEKTVATAN